MTPQYWYMLPVAIVFGALATASGIGGATFFAPLFVLGLGITPEVAIGAALIIEVFGFSSGFLAYARKRLIDYGLGITLLATTIPMALVGVWMSQRFEPDVLKGILGVGLFVVAASALRTPERETVERMDGAIRRQYAKRRGEICLVTAEGEEICYTVCNRTEGRLIAAAGALFKGMIGTGLGEINEHFLLERCHVPSVVSVATGVYVLLLTSLAAAAGHLVGFLRSGGGALDPTLGILIFSIPGVLIGGQLGPWMAGIIPERAFDRVLHVLLLLAASLVLVEVVV
jgi:uncharacterized membrane protein YfcA